VLAGVLLHVIQAARPVNPAIDFAVSTGDSTRCAMRSPSSRHQLPLRRDRAGVVRLPAGRRIKCRAIEVEHSAVRRPVKHARVKFPQIRIGVVKAVRS